MDEDKRTYSAILMHSVIGRNKTEDCNTAFEGILTESDVFRTKAILPFDKMLEHNSAIDDIGYKLHKLQFIYDDSNLLAKVAGNILLRKDNYSLLVYITNTHVSFYSNELHCMEIFQWAIDGISSFCSIHSDHVKVHYVQKPVKQLKAKGEV